MSNDKIAEIRMRHERDNRYGDGLYPGAHKDRAALLAEVERLREALRRYAHQYCELGEASEGCGKLPGDECGGCPARAALEAKP